MPVILGMIVRVGGLAGGELPVGLRLTAPVVASGTVKVMPVVDQLCTVAEVEPMLTLPCCGPKPPPFTVTVSPTAALPGVTLLMIAVMFTEPAVNCLLSS